MSDNEKPKSRKPDYKLGALNKQTEERSKIGAGWINEDGSISIALDPFIVIPSSKDVVLTLFPNDWRGGK